MGNCNAIKVKLLEAIIHSEVSPRDLQTWRTHFLPDLYVLPDDRILFPKIKAEVLECAVTASNVFDAWLILDCIESGFSQEVQNIYASHIG